MLPIESKMEVFAKTYSKDTGVEIITGGTGFCTDGKKIYIVPITDQYDPWIRFMTEVVVYHETGHILTNDVAGMPKTSKSEKHIYNVVRDVVVEHAMETKYPGMKAKWVEFLTRWIKEKTNTFMADPNSPVFTKLLQTLYIKAREKHLGINLNLNVPKEIQELFNKKLAQFIDPVSKLSSIKESLNITKRILKVLEEEKKDEKSKQDKSQKTPNQGTQGDDSDSSQDSTGEGNEGNNSETSDKDIKENNNEDTPSRNSDNNSNENSKPKESNSSKSDSSRNATGCGNPNSSGSEEDQTSSDNADKERTESNSPSGDGSSQPLSDAAKEALKRAQQEMVDPEGKTISEEASEQINEYVKTNEIYREALGLKEFSYQIDPQKNWEDTVAQYEKEGRELVGYVGGKLKTLLISERAPVWQYNLRSGRLDTRKLWKIRTGSKDLCRRKTEGIYEDAVVYEVIDNSSSMNGYRGDAAQKILTAVSSDLDKLRIPFGAVGFTSGAESGHIDATRRRPCCLNLIKSFEEPYRRVRHRFVWPSMTEVTAEFPAIKFAVQQLARRRETKKVLFILTDGETSTGNPILNTAMRKAMKEYVARLIRVGIKVVGIGIMSGAMSYYCPDFIYVQDLSLFGKEFYSKLTKLLL